MLLFAPNLSYLITQRGVKLQALGKFVGVTHSTISNWRDGIQYPDVKKLVKLCEYFDISPNDFIFKDLTTEVDVAPLNDVFGNKNLIVSEDKAEYLRSISFEERLRLLEDFIAAKFPDEKLK